jgi:hypothetical protein
MKKVLFALALSLIASISFSQYVPWGAYVSSNGPHGQNYIRYQLIDNVLYAATSRFTVTCDKNLPGLDYLFNGVYDQSGIFIYQQTATFTIDLASKGNPTLTYCAGNIYLHFYSFNFPESVTGRVQNQDGVWTDITDWANIATNTTAYKVLRGRIPMSTYLNKIEITITPQASTPTLFAQWEFITDRVGQYENGVVTKFDNQSLYRTLAWKNGNNQQTASIDNNGNAQFNSVVLPTGVDPTNQFIGTTASQKVSFRTANLERLTITAAGDVGIGTVSPQSKLAVNGQITSTKVKVTQTGWSDYVFHKSYQLPSLEYVEAYIKQHQHLPDVPSASDVEKDGLDVGDNQAILLKKIEELTLYMIEQNKKLEQQIKKSNQLEKEISDLKKQVKKK